MAERMSLDAAVCAVLREIDRAKRKHPGDFHGRHEGFAVLLEEVDELKDCVWHDGPDYELREEAVQVAAMALRILTELCPPETQAHDVDRLATFIMQNVPGEPSRSEGAIDTAIRILSRHYVAEPLVFTGTGLVAPEDVVAVERIEGTWDERRYDWLGAFVLASGVRVASGSSWEKTREWFTERRRPHTAQGTRGGT